jgi:hypothetical protein
MLENTDHGPDMGFYGPLVNQSEQRILKSHIINIFILFSASLLLNNLFGLLTTEEYLNCKAVYLHVLTTNYVALRFYERHKFRLFRYLPCYYAIQGRQKNGYLYVLYINGGKPPWTFSYPF